MPTPIPRWKPSPARSSAARTASTKVISRDRHADYVQTLALVGASLERFSTEIRNLQRTDVLEVEENFAKGRRQLRHAPQAQPDPQ